MSLSKSFTQLSFAYQLLFVSLIWAIAYFVIKPDVEIEDTSLEMLPAFKSLTQVKEKKQAFFDYFGALASAENARILGLRKEIEKGLDDDELSELAALYRVELSSPPTQNDIDALLNRVNVLPSSIVLAQGAIESAWGTSRFALEGYNYFGQWCFSEGCGIVPSARPAGATHEVQKFSSPQQAVRAYFLNINRHGTYQKLRELRAQALENNRAIHGCELALGLGSYSERGTHYINEVRQMIRINKLESDLSLCKAIPEPTEKSEHDAEAQANAS